MVQLRVINFHADISPFSLQISSIDAEWSRLVCQIQTLPRSDQMKPTYDQKLLGMCADAQAGVEMETRACRHSVHVLRGPTRSQRYLHAIHQPWQPRTTSPAAQTRQGSPQYRWVYACSVLSQSWSGYAKPFTRGYQSEISPHLAFDAGSCALRFQRVTGGGARAQAYIAVAGCRAGRPQPLLAASEAPFSR